MGKDWLVNRAGFFPSPLVGEGGSIAQGAIETDEGPVSAERTPHPALRATFSHKGRRKKATLRTSRQSDRTRPDIWNGETRFMTSAPNISPLDQARILSEALPHMQQYDEETIVIKY